MVPPPVVQAVFYVASLQGVVSLRLGTWLSLTFLALPVLSQLIFKASASKSCRLYKLREFSPSDFQVQMLL